jgi:L-seryl-tRNA(Ser) seleniumtransferase
MGNGFLGKHSVGTVINVSGTMTALGASRVGASVAETMADVLPHFVRMTELQAAASRLIARVTGGKAGCVTACTASGMVAAIAGCMTGADLGKIEQLPDTSGMKSECILQRGHAVNFGAGVRQMIRLTGASCVEIGSVNACGAYQFENAVTDGTAAAVYVVSHHTVQSGLIALADFAAAAHRHGIPVIVDVASEYDLTGFLSAGADIVVWSGHKFLGGPTSGIVAGRKDLVRATYLQEYGIARAMKVGKESVAGVMTALEDWMQRDHGQVRAEEDSRIAAAEEALAGIPGIATAREPDPTHNPITRLRVTVNPADAGISAFQLSRMLATGEPAIQVRDHHVDRGYFLLDPCNVTDGEMATVCRRIRACLQEPVESTVSTENLADLRTQILRAWPDV